MYNSVSLYNKAVVYNLHIVIVKHYILVKLTGALLVGVCQGEAIFTKKHCALKATIRCVSRLLIWEKSAMTNATFWTFTVHSHK